MGDRQSDHGALEAAALAREASGYIRQRLDAARASMLLLARWSDCREAHATAGICHEDHEALIAQTDSAMQAWKESE